MKEWTPTKLPLNLKVIQQPNDGGVIGRELKLFMSGSGGRTTRLNSCAACEMGIPVVFHIPNRDDDYFRINPFRVEKGGAIHKMMLKLLGGVAERYFVDSDTHEGKTVLFSRGIKTMKMIIRKG